MAGTKADVALQKDTEDTFNLQREIENVCKALGQNSFHEMADLNYKTEKRYNENCKKALFDYYDRNYSVLGNECVDKLVEYIQEHGKDFGLNLWGHNTELKQIKHWLEQIEVNYEILKQEYANEQQQEAKKTAEATKQSDASKKVTPEAKKVLLQIPPGLSMEERRETENALFKAGARYTKETIPAERSTTGREVHYKKWYVMQYDDTDMTPFHEYVKQNRTNEKPTRLNEDHTQSKETQAPPNTAENKSAAASQKEAEGAAEKRIYLNIPPMTKLAFGFLTTYFKNNGAKFDGAVKAWYITDKQDFNKFKDYLGLTKEQVQNKRESVLNKLNENRATIQERQDAGKEAGREIRQRDTLSK